MKRSPFSARWPTLAALVLLSLVASFYPERARAATTITATVTITNAAVLTNASFGTGATITVNGDARTWTNTVTSPGTQIPLTSVNGTNIAQQVQLLTIHAAAHPWTTLTPSSDGITFVKLRAAVGQTIAISIVPTNYASLTLSTQTVGSAYVVRMPITVESPTVRTNIANDLLAALDYGSIGALTQLGSSNATVKPIRLSAGLVSVEAGSGINLTSGATSIVVSASGSATGNSVWVSKTGDDGTGVRGSLSTSFLTITAAEAASSAGDTVFVLPGVYPEADLLKDQINLHFFNGAVVTNTDVSLAIFQDVNGALTATISGDGQFTGDGSTPVVVMANASTVRIRGTILGGNTTIQADNGTLTIEDSTIDSGGLNQPILISGTGAVLNLNRCRVVASATNDSTIAIALSASNNDLTLRDCVLISGGTNSVTASGAVNARIYGSLTANVTNNANVTWLTGSSRFEVSTDVR